MPRKSAAQMKIEQASEVAARVESGEKKFSLADVRALYYGFKMLKPFEKEKAWSHKR